MKKNIYMEGTRDKGRLDGLNTIENKKKQIKNQEYQKKFFKNKKKKKFNKDPNWLIEIYFSFRAWVNDSLFFYKIQFKKLLTPFAIYCFTNLLKNGFFVEAKIFLFRIKIDIEKKIFNFDKNFMNFFFLKKINTDEIIKIFEKKVYRISLTINALNLLLNFSETQISWCFLKFLNEKIKISLKKKKDKKLIEIKSKKKKDQKKKISLMKKKTKINIYPNFFSYKKNPVKICKIFKLVTTQKHLVNSFDFSNNEETILTGWQNSHVYVIDQIKENNKKKNFSLIGHTGPVYTAKLSKCNNFILSGTCNGELNLWSLKFQKLLVKYQNTHEPIWDISFSGLNPFFLTGGNNHLASLWASNCLYPVRLFIGHQSDVNVVRWHPSNLLIGTGSNDGISYLWDIRKAESVARFEEFGHSIHSLEFSPDGFELAIGGLSGKIYIWDLRTNRFKGSIQDTSDSKIIKSFSFSRNGKKFAYTKNKNSIKIWEKMYEKTSENRKKNFFEEYVGNTIRAKIGKIFSLNICMEERISIAGLN